MKLVRVTLAVSLAVLHSACVAATLPLATPPNSNATAAQHNSEGITHYEKGEWEMAREHFISAVEADSSLAESHFNLALALHKLDRHSEATTHFKKAGELAHGNQAITQSSVYRKHVAPPSSIYGPSGYGGMGGY